MKDMSYRDKMVILVISIIIILVAGFFALIKPKYDKLVTDTSTYETTKTEWDGIKQKLDAIPGLKDEITEKYTAAKKDAEMFVNPALGDLNDTYYTDHVNYSVDQYIQPALDAANLEVTTFALGSTGSVAVDFYYYSPNVVTYALLEAADINGNYAEKMAEAMQKETVLKEIETTDLIGQNVALSLNGTREQLMTFLDAIKDDKNAILVESVDIGDYQFKGGLEENEVVSVDAEGNEVRTVVKPAADEEGTSSLTLSVTFYNAKAIDVPDLGD